jgi:4-hydroxy-4-methyl-2-oxoglutarate aldolase
VSAPTVTDPVVRDGRKHSAATLYEAAQAERVEAEVAVDPGIRAAWTGAAVAGPAFTVQGAGGDNLALHRAVLAAPAGSVLVADLSGAAHGHWGEVLAVAAQQRGIAGLVIDGGVRDVDEMRDLGFPVFSRNDTVRGTRKLFAGVLGVDIRLGGVPVRTGDLVVGDADGVVALPAALVPDVLDRADARVAQEATILEQLRAGATTLELYGLDPRGQS